MTKSRIYADGGYIYIDGQCVQGWHKCGDKEFFAHQKDYTGELDTQMLKWLGAPIPKEIMLKVAALAYEFPAMEVMVCLYYSTKERKWLANVPRQKGHGAYVKYDDEDFKEPEGYAFLGTIHTHPGMNAFWSGTDRNDQNRKNGLHMVLGLRDGRIDQVLCSLFFNGKQYDQPDAFELPSPDEPLPEVDSAWKAKVELQVVPAPAEPLKTWKPSVSVKDDPSDLSPEWDALSDRDVAWADEYELNSDHSALVDAFFHAFTDDDFRYLAARITDLFSGDMKEAGIDTELTDSDSRRGLLSSIAERLCFSIYDGFAVLYVVSEEARRRRMPDLEKQITDLLAEEYSSGFSDSEDD